MSRTQRCDHATVQKEPVVKHGGVPCDVQGRNTLRVGTWNTCTFGEWAIVGLSQRFNSVNLRNNPCN